MSDFKTMIKGMEEKETPKAPTQEESEKQDTYTDKQGKQVKVLGTTESGKRIIPYKDWKRHVGGEKGVKKRVKAWIDNQTKKEAPLAGKLQLNIPTHKPTSEELNKEVTDMFKSREEAYKWLEENKGEMSEGDIANAKARFDKAFPTRKVGNEEFPAPQRAQYQESRFLKDDPYYKLIKEKSPMSYREHLYYPENGKFALHDTEGNKIGEFDDEENTLAAIDKRYSDKAGSGENNVAPSERRLLEPTDTFTQKELDDYAEYINVAEEPDGYYIKKMDDGNYLTNVKADLSSIPTGDAHDAEPTVVTPSQLGEILREHLQNSPELSDYLYEFTSDRARKEIGKGLEDKARKAWEEHLKYVLAEPTEENIEKGNRTGEEFADIVYPYLTDEEVDKWDTISGTYKDPQEEWDYLADIFGWQK